MTPAPSCACEQPFDALTDDELERTLVEGFARLDHDLQRALVERLKAKSSVWPTIPPLSHKMIANE